MGSTDKDKNDNKQVTNSCKSPRYLGFFSSKNKQVERFRFKHEAIVIYDIKLGGEDTRIYIFVLLNAAASPKGHVVVRLVGAVIACFGKLRA